MANLVITSTATKIKVVFNAMAGDFEKGTWTRESLKSVQMSTDYVEIHMIDNAVWTVSFDSNYMQIDLIDGVAPTSNADLYDKLDALML